MINKLSTLKLVLGLVILVLVYLAVTFLSKGDRSDVLKSDLVSIDTAAVSSISIESPGSEVHLSRVDDRWLIERNDGEPLPADKDQVQSLLATISEIKPTRLVARESSKWPDYGVDSSATRVKLLDADATVLNLLVGQTGTNAYVRLEGDEQVYSSQGFFGLQGRQQINDFRNAAFLNLNPDSVTVLNFTYPADSSFTVSLEEGVWKFSDGSLADSTAVSSYLNQLRNISSRQFAESVSPQGDNLASLQVGLRNGTEIKVEAIAHPLDSVLLRSSINSQAFIKDHNLNERIFKGRPHFTSN